MFKPLIFSGTKNFFFSFGKTFSGNIVLKLPLSSLLEKLHFLRQSWKKLDNFNNAWPIISTGKRSRFLEQSLKNWSLKVMHLFFTFLQNRRKNCWCQFFICISSVRANLWTYIQKIDPVKTRGPILPNFFLRKCIICFPFFAVKIGYFTINSF